jgi:vacuolar-type H+-ATPase subunit I/STV1
MQEIDVLIDDHTDLALEMVDCDIRNQNAHRELQNFNDNGVFLGIHRLSEARNFSSDQLSELSKLKAENPTGFLNEITNVIQNIRRIESNLRTKKYKTDEERSNWELNLSKSKIKHDILKQLL